MESKAFKQAANEAAYNWDIDPIDRAWFITQPGELSSGMSHRLILKKRFQKDWDIASLAETDDDVIERILTYRLLKTGGIKIGELDDFYSVVNYLDNIAKDALCGFARSILKTRDVGNKLFSIQQTGFNGNTVKYTVSEIATNNAWR